MKKTLMLALAVLLVLPMLFSCQTSQVKTEKYGTEEKAVTVTVVIENPDYVPPTTEAPEGEEPEVDPENPEFFFNGTVDLYVKNPTIKDALLAAFAKIEDTYSCSIDEDNNVSIEDHTDSFSAANSVFWEYSINGIKAEKSITAETLKANEKLTAVFTSFLTETGEAPASSAN